MKLLFVHGWGFDARFWDALAPLLPEWEQARHDRGYFGGSPQTFPAEPCIAVAHSFGAMRVLADPPPHCVGMVAINGFDRFTAREGKAGVAMRLVDRMIDRLAVDPVAVLDDFRHRCGAEPASGQPCVDLLHKDLASLRDDDRGPECGRWRAPLLSLHGADDPILPADLRSAAFSAAPDLTCGTKAGGGHLLPVTSPDWCAHAIRAFIARVGACA